MLICALPAGQPLKCWQNSIPLNQHPEWMVWMADVWYHCQPVSPVNKASGSLRASFSHPFRKPQRLLTAHYHVTWLNCLSHITDHAVILPCPFSSVICSFLLVPLLTYFTVRHLDYIPVSACLLKLSRYHKAPDTSTLCTSNTQSGSACLSSFPSQDPWARPFPCPQLLVLMQP